MEGLRADVADKGVTEGGDIDLFGAWEDVGAPDGREGLHELVAQALFVMRGVDVVEQGCYFATEISCRDLSRSMLHVPSRPRTTAGAKTL